MNVEKCTHSCDYSELNDLVQIKINLCYKVMWRINVLVVCKKKSYHEF